MYILQDFRNYVSSANQCHCLVLYCQRVNLKQILWTLRPYICKKKKEEKMNYLIYNPRPDHDINLWFPSSLIKITIRKV